MVRYSELFAAMRLSKTGIDSILYSASISPFFADTAIKTDPILPSIAAYGSFGSKMSGCPQKK